MRDTKTDANRKVGRVDTAGLTDGSKTTCDLARAALVCLAGDDTVSALQADIDDVWGASNTTTVFGLSEIRGWSDCGGKVRDRHSLKTWLES